MTINHTADWWLGDLSGPYVQAIGDSIKAEWGTEPLWIREGGSIPGIPFLEQECMSPTNQAYVLKTAQILISDVCVCFILF